MFLSLIRNSVGQLERCQVPALPLRFGLRDCVYLLSNQHALDGCVPPDKRLPWWGPRLTTKRLSPQTDDDLKLPPLHRSSVFWPGPGPPRLLLFVRWLPPCSSRRRGSSQPTNPRIIMFFSAFANEKPLWVEAGLNPPPHPRYNAKEYFPQEDHCYFTSGFFLLLPALSKQQRKASLSFSKTLIHRSQAWHTVFFF